MTRRNNNRYLDLLKNKSKLQCIYYFACFMFFAHMLWTSMPDSAGVAVNLAFCFLFAGMSISYWWDGWGRDMFKEDEEDEEDFSEHLID